MGQRSQAHNKAHQNGGAIRMRLGIADPQTGMQREGPEQDCQGIIARPGAGEYELRVKRCQSHSTQCKHTLLGHNLQYDVVNEQQGEC